MAKASDNLFPKVLVTEGAAPTSPATGNQALFVDSSDHKLKRVNSAGAVTIVEGGGSPGRVLLKEVVLAAGALTIGFTSSDIPTSGYKHLEVRLMARSTRAAQPDDELLMFFNGDTTQANYASSRYTQATQTALAYPAIGYVPGASAAAGYAGLVKIEVPNFLDSTFFQNAWHQSWTPNEPYVTHGPVVWKNTAAITAINLTLANNFTVGSTAQLYGLV